MATSMIQKIADALLARINSVSGIGDTGLRRLTTISTFPACFLIGVEGDSEPGTMGGPGRLTSWANFTWQFYHADVEAFLELADLHKSIKDAIHTAPYNLGVEGVMRPHCKPFKLYDPATSPDFGIGEFVVHVPYVEAYGSA